MSLDYANQASQSPENSPGLQILLWLLGISLIPRLSAEAVQWLTVTQ